MPIITDKELSADKRALWLKALSAVELRNYGYAISLISNVIKDAPGFLEGRKVLRRAEIAATKGRKSFLSGLSTASLKGGGMIKKDPLAAMELAEKSLESDPYNTQANHLLKDAAKAAEYPEIAAFALETIMEANPKDTKLMHELAEFYIAMGHADRAVDVYTRINTINPQDLVALKRSKDASAQASMTKGGWEKAQSYRDLIKDKDQAKSLEEKGRVVRDVDMIENQLAELQPQWDQDQTNVDLTKRICKLWDERFEQKQDDESLSGAVWYFNYLNDFLKGSDPAVARKLSDLQQKQTEIQIKQFEEWLAADGVDEHPDVQQVRDQLETLKQAKAASLIDEAKKRVERNPTDLQLRFELGERLLAAGNFNDAVPELQKARQNPNTRLRAMSLLGRCFVLKGMLDMATTQFQSAASEMTAMDAVKKDTLYELAMVLEKMGKREEYLKCLKDIIEVDYGYRDAAARVEQSYGS
ncbi:MAG TPA: tetratricopeptide repeat protein [Chthoniobacteraceae bacterium]|nr:tetratricopeptide repeat protein [Chthoniobacteraceae bacterium]